MSKLKEHKITINNAAMLIIGVFCGAYALYYKKFAEFHVQLQFLNFPIFVGEILLFLCLILFITKYCRNVQKLNKIHYALGAYFVFILIKTLIGYLAWGPLALRHAALHYYLIFAVFGCVFFDKKKFSRDFSAIIIAVIIAILYFKTFYIYYTFTLSCLALILIIHYPTRPIKYAMLLALFLSIPYQYLFLTSRMMILGNGISGLFLAITLPLILNIKRKMKIILTVALCALIGIALFKYAPHAALKSIVNINKMATLFEKRDKIVQSRKHDFPYRHLTDLKVYNPDSNQVNDPISSSTVQMLKTHVKSAYRDEINNKVNLEGFLNEETENTENDSRNDVEETEPEAVYRDVKNRIDTMKIERFKGKIPAIVLEEVKDELMEEYSVKITNKKAFNDRTEALKKEGYVVNDNAVFRLFIWRDMLVDMFQQRKIFGIDYGYPFRSVSMEILDWAHGDWTRDGWISPHNSYLHLIYRSGIVGVAVVFAVFTILGKMIFFFARERSVTGILLCSIIINWFVAANFLVTLELPYSAIPIWTIYGMTIAYYIDHKSKNKINEAGV